MKNILVVTLFYCICFAGLSQKPHSVFPEVDKPFPEFKLNNVENFRLQSVSNDDLKGRWFIIDFWHSRCGVCISSMPKMDKLRKAFQNDLDILFVGYNKDISGKDDASEDAKIKDLYKKIESRMDLSLPMAYDSVMFDQFSLSSCPYIIVVNNQGIVKGITHFIDSVQISNFLQGKVPILTKAWRKNELPVYDSSKNLLSNGYGGEESNLLCKSVFAKSSEYMPSSSGPRFYKNKFEYLQAPLIELYNLAYFGRPVWTSYDKELYGVVSLTPILNTKDSSTFWNTSNRAEDNRFGYSIVSPEISLSRDQILSSLKSDLKRSLPYDVIVVEKENPYWKLVAYKGKKKTEVYTNEKYINRFQQQFTSINELISFLQFFSFLPSTKMPIIDETGLKAFKADLITDYTNDAELDYQLLRKSLNSHGLDLVKGTRKMKVLLVKDKKN